MVGAPMLWSQGTYISDQAREIGIRAEDGVTGMVVMISLELTAKEAVKAVRRKDLIIVIDVLRSGSSMLNALANGAEALVPAKTLAEAYEIKREHPEYLLAGERKALRPRGFDFGNSPLEFKRKKVQGRTLIFTTTSGTAALMRSKPAGKVLMGAFLNARKVAEKALATARGTGGGISIALSGRKGLFSLEDFICGGAIVSNLFVDGVDLSDASVAAFLSWRHVANSLFTNVMKGEHARHLASLGFERDIEFSCQLDLFKIVPIYKDGVIKRGD